MNLRNIQNIFWVERMSYLSTLSLVLESRNSHFDTINKLQLVRKKRSFSFLINRLGV